MIRKTFNHFGFCCGLGGGAKGFNMARSQVGNMEATWRSIGGIDVDPAAARDYQRLVGTPCSVMDLFTREQYTAFHGKEPPAGWTEATPEDVRRAASNEHPHAVFISSPCKGASGLLSETMSKTPKYQALNELTLRCIWLMCEAWKADPVELIVFENVPRLATRGRHLLDQIGQLLNHYGYAVAETTHDCGELGGLAQSRKRMLLVARHMERVPSFLYEPQMKRLQGVGTVLGRMPMPGDAAGGPMHRIPALQWKTWVRLAFVEAGSDWRSLNKLAVQDGALRDFVIVPERGLPTTVDDPRTGVKHNNCFRVVDYSSHSGTVTGGTGPSAGGQAVADPRAPEGATQYQQYGVLRWEEHAGTITGFKSPGQGMFSVADPRRAGPTYGKYAVTRWDTSTGCVIAGSTTGQGAYAVADPRTIQRDRGDAYLTGGHYGVVGWEQPSGAVSASACHDNGRWSVADPRIPQANEKAVAIIRALDGTWHRPFTTLEMAALQSLVEPEEYLELDGLSDEAWRERIGNAVPPRAGQAIAEVMGTTLLLAGAGETFMLSATPIWVQPVAVALSMAQGGVA